MKESEWTEAEKACVEVAKMHTQGVMSIDKVTQLVELGLKLLAELEVKPVFPGEGFSLLDYGYISSQCEDLEEEALQGNTFETKELAEKESTRREAKTRVREKINLANEGDNGFGRGSDNYCIRYNHDEGKLDVSASRIFQSQFDWEYIQGYEVAEELLKDKELVADWLLMKGIKE
jgi:hypothetical protein